MSIVKKVKFENLGDLRGDLISLEQFKNIPFEIKRVYYLANTKKRESRGFHAHKKLKQVLIAVSGRCKVILDDGCQREEVILDSFQEGLLIESFVWREMHDFSENCVLLVIASEHYDEDDYLRNYEEFMKVVKNGTNT